MHPSKLAKRGTVLLFLAVIGFYFYGLGHLPLLGPDEPRYAQVAREMFLRHDLITPTLGGHVWFEKPALLYWMMIASFKLFGVSEWAARVPSALAGLLTIAAVYVVSRQVTGVATQTGSHGFAFWCVLVSATTVGLAVFSRAASFDIVLTMTTTWALAFYLLHEFAVEEKVAKWWLAGFYAFIGFSLLAKGLVGIVVPIGVVGLYSLLARRLPKRSTLISVLWGLPLALVIASVWYAPVIRLHGWLFIDQFFIQHHFARYVSNKYHHRAAFYYYLLIVPLLALPWTPFLIEAVWNSKRRLFANFHHPRSQAASAASSQSERRDRLMIFSVAWLLFPMMFFSLSSSKLPGYVVPALPAVAFIVGERLWRLASDNSILPGLAIAIAAVTVVVLIVALHRAAPAFADHQSSKRLLQLADARGYSDAPIYGLRRDDRSPEFYAADRIVYAADGEPVMYEGVGQVVWESRRRQQTILTMVPLRDVELFRQLSSMRVDFIGDNERIALVAIGPP